MCNLHLSNTTFASTVWYNEHGYVPTVEQMKNVYNIPPKEEDEQKHQHALDFLL